MKKIYKFYDNVIKTEDIDNWDFRKEIANINNGYRSIDIDIENEITTFDVKRTFSFSYSIYYPNYNNEIIDELKRLGYSQSSVAGNGKHLFTNPQMALFYFTDGDYNNGGIGYVCNNILEARDIAAIQNKCDINQLFKFPNDEPAYCTCFSHVDEWGDFEDTNYPKKMTPEEIIEYYKTFEIHNFYK